MSKKTNKVLLIGGLALGGYGIYKLIDSALKEKSPKPVLNDFPITFDTEGYDSRVLSVQKYLNNVMELNEDGLSPISENGYYTTQFRNRLEFFMNNYIWEDYTDEEISALGYVPSMVYGRGDFISEELYLMAANSIYGCTDSSALNYNPSANADDGSCIDVIQGCTDESAANYNENANQEDGSCYYQPDFG